MFASGIAFCLSRLDNSDSRNVIDWVVFFGSYQNYTNLEDVCDVWCIVCVLLWIVCFAAGCFIQYKCHRRHKRKDNDDEYESDSELTEYDYSPDQVPAKRKKRESVEVIEMGMNPQYAGSLRVANHYPIGSESSHRGGGSMLGVGGRPGAPSTIAYVQCIVVSL